MENAAKSGAELRPVYFARVLENVGEGDICVAEDELVRHRGTEHVSQAGGHRIGLVLSEDRSRVWHLVAIAPPQTDRETSAFPAACCSERTVWCCR